MSSDESPAVVELPDDLIEQARTDLALACLSGPSDVQAARFAEFERLIAARVRAEAEGPTAPCANCGHERHRHQAQGEGMCLDCNCDGWCTAEALIGRLRQLLAQGNDLIERVRAEAEQRLAAVVVQVIDPETAAAETVTWGDALRMLTAWLGADGWTPSERRVRAEAVAEHRADLQHRIEVSAQIEAEKRLAVAERDEYHRNWQEAEKRNAKAVAEAVADERQRLADLVSQAREARRDGTPWPRYNVSERIGMTEAVRLIRAAGSVPVATPDAYASSAAALCETQCGKPTDHTCAQWGCGPVATPTEPKRWTAAEVAEFDGRLAAEAARLAPLFDAASGPDEQPEER